MRHHSTTSGLAPPPLPSKQYLMDRLGNLEIDPKGFFRNAANGSSNRGAAHLANEPRDESVEAKWEHLQYYEARLQDPQMSLELPHPAATDNNTYNSMASCSTGSSTSSANSQSSSGSRLSARSMKEGWKRFKSQILRRGGSGSNRMNGTTSYNDFGPVSTAPSGDPTPSSAEAAAANGVMSRIRSSKSLQNLDSITRDSYYNLRGATSNLREKYHSRLELRQAKPKADYAELWDEDDEEELTRHTLKMVGLE